MQEAEHIEKLREFAGSTGRTFDSEVTEYPKSGINTFQKYRAWAYVQEKERGGSVFVCFSDPYARFGQSTIYSGAFVPLPPDIKSELLMRKKDVFDSINPFSKTRVNALGNRIFDSRVVISGKMGLAERSLLSSSMLQRQIIDSLSDAPGLLVYVNTIHPGFVPWLDDMACLGIVYPRGWQLEDALVERLLFRAEKIRECLPVFPNASD
jgi:hypothetical protein